MSDIYIGTICIYVYIYIVQDDLQEAAYIFQMLEKGNQYICLELFSVDLNMYFKHLHTKIQFAWHFVYLNFYN